MNPLLQKVQAAVLQKADPRLVPVIQKIAAAGKQFMYSPKNAQLLKQQLGKGNDPETIAAGVAKLVGILYHQSKNTIPMQALVPASVLLMCEGLDFLEQAGTIKVNPDLLSQCTMALGSNIAQLFGVSPAKLQGMVNQGKQGAPATMPPPAAAPPQVAPQPPGGIIASQQGAM